MNFGFTDEQDLLRAEARRFLDQNCPLEQVRKLAETPEGFSRDLWAAHHRRARSRTSQGLNG